MLFKRGNNLKKNDFFFAFTVLVLLLFPFLFYALLLIIKNSNVNRIRKIYNIDSIYMAKGILEF